MKIVTPVCNNPLFIELQYLTFKKFCCDTGYEFSVFNDAKDFPDKSNFGDTTIKQQIQDVCKRLNLQCITIPNEKDVGIPSFSIRHARTMNFIFDYMKKNPDQYWVIDSDMFPVADFHLSSMSRFEASVVLQERPGIQYVWPNYLYFDMHKLKHKELVNFMEISGKTDSGGEMWKWLEKYQTESPFALYPLQHLISLQWDEKELPSYLKNNALLSFLKTDPRNQEGKFWCELYDGCLLHYRAGSNWAGEGRDLHDTLTQKLAAVLRDL
jgi:hypothetical protein